MWSQDEKWPSQVSFDFGNKFPVWQKCSPSRPISVWYLWFVIFNLSTFRVLVCNGRQSFSPGASGQQCLPLPTRSSPGSVWWSLSMKEGSTSVAYKPGNIINVLSDFSNWSLNTNSLISGWISTVIIPMWDVTHHWLIQAGLGWAHSLDNQIIDFRELNKRY